MNGSSGKEIIFAKLDSAVADGRLSADSATNIKQWLSAPYYNEYRKPIEDMVEAEAFAELDRLFWEVIGFGTGGRRGPMAEFGSATVNERTIAESAYGLAVYFEKLTGKSGGRAVVAHDTRNRSQEFARLTAATLAARGFHVFVFDSHRSTPELSFAVRHLQCDIGVMISASHNPPADNGFKAYSSSGGQILDPEEEDAPNITDCVMQAREIDVLDFDDAVRAGRIEMIGEEIDRAYLAAVTSLELSDDREVAALFSPLHGVGETSVFRVLEEAGFRGVEIFEPHQKPDGNFPNVPDRLPNPERPEVFAPLIAQAKASGAEIILASDPDADRVGVAVKRPDGEFVIVSGNRVGALLTDYVLRKRRRAGTLTSDHYIVETMVTTRLIAAIGSSYGVRVVNNLLVGFKYIAEAMDREGPGKFVFGAEESLGYLAGEYCRDKDAALAALYVMELAAELGVQNKTLLDRLDELFIEHGYFVEGQRSTVCEGPSGKKQIDALMQAFRDTPPTELGGFRFTTARDYERHEVRRLPENVKAEELPKPKGNVLILVAESDAGQFLLAARPSGTEPKIKFYSFGQAPCPNAEALPEIKQRTDDALKQFQDVISGWVEEMLAQSNR